MEARRKSKQLRPIKRRRPIRSELKEGETEILYSTHDIEDDADQDIHTETMNYERISTTENDQFRTKSAPQQQTRSVSDEINKLLPEIRKPIKPTGEYLYGPNAIYTALKAKKRPFYHRLYLSPIDKSQTNSKRQQYFNEIVSLCDSMHIPIEYCSKKELNHFVSKNMHNGFVLDCDHLSFASTDNEPLEYSHNAIWIAFDHLMNEENVGAVLRNALFFGINGCVYPSKYCSPLSPLVACASAGALDGIDVRICNGQLSEYLRKMKEKKWNIVGLDVVGNTGKYDAIATQLDGRFKAKNEGPMIVVIGNESKGISKEVRDECDELIYINGSEQAMEYNVDSLNVASACSIALYQLTQSRQS